MANGGGIGRDHVGFGDHHAGFGGNPLGRAMAYSRSRLGNPQRDDWMSTPMVGPFSSFLGNVPDNVDLPAGMPPTAPMGYSGLPAATSSDVPAISTANPFSRNAPHAIGLMGFEGRSPIADAVGRASLGRGMAGRIGAGHPSGRPGGFAGVSRSGGAPASGPPGTGRGGNSGPSGPVGGGSRGPGANTSGPSGGAPSGPSGGGSRGPGANTSGPSGPSSNGGWGGDGPGQASRAGF
jgi:hypothetical protein